MLFRAIVAGRGRGWSNRKSQIGQKNLCFSLTCSLRPFRKHLYPEMKKPAENLQELLKIREGMPTLAWFSVF